MAENITVGANNSNISNDFYLSVSKGHIPGHAIVNKFGRNKAITTGFDLMSIGATYGMPTTAQSLEVISGDADDNGSSQATLTCVNAVALTAATGTVTMATVLENTFSTGTVTCLNAVANTFSTGTVTCLNAVANTFSIGTVTAATAIQGNTATINGLVYTGVDGAKSDNTEFSVDTGNNETAADLADSINNDVRVGTLGDVSANAVAAVVTLTSDVAGVAGDATTLVSSGATLAVSGATFASGVDADTFEVNGLTYTGVAGVKSDNTEFSIDTSDILCATDIVDSITNDVRAGTSGDVSAANGGTAVVTFTTDVEGVAGDAITLSSTDGVTLAVSGAVFSGGVDADTFTVNGLLYTGVAGAKSDNTEFSIDTSDIAAATDIVDSITNDARSGTSGDISAANGGTAVVTMTTDVAGTAGDAITLVSSDGVTLAVSAATFSGGVDADTCTINGLVYTAVAGAKSDNTEFSTDTSDIATATDLADSITNDARTGTLNDVTAASGGTAIVTCTQTVGGTAGNATTLVSSDGVTLAVSGATFSGGLEADTVTVNGLLYTAVAGAKADDTQFSIDTSDDATALDLADSIDGDVRVGITVPTVSLNASANTNVVTVDSDDADAVDGTTDISASANITASAAFLTASLTGGHRIVIEGLDDDWTFQTKTVILNGLTAVAIPGTWRRFFRAYLDRSGTYISTAATTSHEGIITIRIAGAGATWGLIDTLGGAAANDEGMGQTQIGCYTVPAGKTAHLLNKHFSVDSNKDVTFYLFRRENADDVVSEFNGVLRLVSQYDAVSAPADFTARAPMAVFPEKTDIVWIGKGAAASAASVEFQLLLIDN